MASIDGTCLILRIHSPSIMKSPLFESILYLLDMNYQPREVHVIIEYRRPTILLQISVDFCDEPGHLIPVVRYKESSIPGLFNKLHRILPDCH